MTIEIAVISAQTIKPSSPTPKSQQKHHLSFLDQFMQSTFSSFVYFYSSNPQIPNSQKSTTLKKTLSEVLSIYYPLGGRLVGNRYVDCNDGGVPFSEAEVDCNLSQVITDRDPASLKKFLPYNTDGSHSHQDFCMAVQATYFRCGGLAVGILFQHKIADALSCISFAKTWSAAARNGHLRGLPPPKFDAAAYFPPLDITGRFQLTKGLTEDALTARIFRFSSSKIAALQEKYSGGGGGGRRTSRSEALSAFIWTQFVSATGIGSDPDKICILQNTVNLRTRADPPLSEYHFGNIVWAPQVKAGAEDSAFEIVVKVRKAVKAIDGGYVARLQNTEKLLKDITAVHQAYKGEAAVRFVFTNICGFPLYEADFGWGRPDRVGLGGFPFKNTVILMGTKSGGGVEALITLTKQDMEKFESSINGDAKVLKSNL